MPNRSDRRSLLIMFCVLLFVVCGTYIVSILARGYRLNLKSGPIIQATGILSATSQPKSASVFINDRLTTATDDVMNLAPGDYNIKITKDGYLPWQKNISIKKEVVYQTEAILFRSVPELSPITQSGAINPTLSPDGSKIIFAVASASASRDNGLYIIETSDNLIPLTKNTPRQIATNYPSIDWSKAIFTFSPNSRQLLAKFETKDRHYLLPLDSNITEKNLVDVTSQLDSITAEWQINEAQIIQSRLDRLPPEIKAVASTESAHHLSFNSKEDKVIYLAKSDNTLPANIITPPPAQSTQIQSRQIKTDNYYVYDLKDDTNFLLGTKSNYSEPLWLPNSSYIIYIEDNSIKAVDYDGTNKLTLFAGNFHQNVYFPWSDGSRLITLTSVYNGAPENLYSISLK